MALASPVGIAILFGAVRHSFNRLPLVLALCIAALSGCQSITPNTTPTPMGKRETEGKSLSELMGGVGTNVKQQAGRIVGNVPINQENAKSLYAEADGIFRRAMAAPDGEKQNLYVAAAVKYQAAAKEWHDSSLEEDGLFASGESYFFADYYPKANDLYEQLIKKYPRTKYIDLAESRRFRIAQWWHDEAQQESSYAFNWTDKSRPWHDTFGNSMRVYDKIRKDDPAGKHADAATLAVANAYFLRQMWDKADFYYDDLRKTFPSSQYQWQAHFLGLKAKLQTYRGPDYDGQALDEAEKLITQIKRQFPQEYQREQAYLARTSAEIRLQKADREMFLAQFYDRRAEYAAARFYYQQVAKTYGDTPLAKDATERIAAIADKPGSPPQYFDWLTNVFPPSQEHKPLLATLPADTTKR